MYRLAGKSTRIVRQAHDFAAVQFARLCQERHMADDEALPFLAPDPTGANRPVQIRGVESSCGVSA